MVGAFLTALNWNSVLMYVIETAFKIIVTFGIPYLFAILRAKFKVDKQNKYMNMFEQLVRDAVSQVQQTYVDNMKEENLFDKAAQLRAFNTAKDIVIALTNEKMKKIVVETVGDFEAYLNNKIEAEVYTSKHNFVEKADA